MQLADGVERVAGHHLQIGVSGDGQLGPLEIDLGFSTQLIQVFLGALTAGDGQELEIRFCGKGLGDADQMRHFQFAGAAPGPPEVDQGDPPLEVVERDGRIRARQGLQLQGRQLLADRLMIARILLPHPGSL